MAFLPFAYSGIRMEKMGMPDNPYCCYISKGTSFVKQILNGKFLMGLRGSEWVRIYRRLGINCGNDKGDRITQQFLSQKEFLYNRAQRVFL